MVMLGGGELAIREATYFDATRYYAAPDKSIKMTTTSPPACKINDNTSGVHLKKGSVAFRLPLI